VTQRVRLIELKRFAGLVGEQGAVAVDLAVNSLGVGVEQQFGGVTSMTVEGVEGTVNPEAIALTGLDRGDEGVPDVSVDLGELDPGLGAVVGDQGELDLVGNLREKGEVDSAAVERGAQGVGVARPDVHEFLRAVSLIVPSKPPILSCGPLRGTTWTVK